MEWQVKENGNAPLPARSTKLIRSRRPAGWVWLVVGLLVIVTLGGALWWRVQQQGENLRASITETIHQEARVLGGQDMTEAEALIDPHAPVDWRWSYLQATSLLRPPSTLPTVQEIRLDDEGMLALVQVAVPRPEGELYDRLEPIVEQRAYRLIEGAWRRTPLPLDQAEMDEQRTHHFVLHGPATVLAELNSDGILLTIGASGQRLNSAIERRT
jgi:hypothetical protein